MRKFIVFMMAILAFGTHAFADTSFVIKPRNYLFSKYFDLYSEDNYINTIEKNELQLRTVYTLLDKESEVAMGTARLLSLGSLFDSMKEIYIRSDDGTLIGMVQGKWWTTASGKFFIHNGEGIHVATAFIDRNEANVSILDPTKNRRLLSTLHRIFVPGGTYYWEVKTLDETIIDPRILQIFSAFIVDAYWPSRSSVDYEFDAFDF